MRIHPLSIFGLLTGAVAASAAPLATMPPSGPYFFVDEYFRPARQSRVSSNAPKRYRTRWKASRPRRRANRIHISRRVRRAHRKAKRA